MRKLLDKQGFAPKLLVADKLRSKVLWTAACILRKHWAYRTDLNRCSEELLAERGVEISYKTVRRWVLKAAPRDGGADRRQADVFWRAVDHESEVLDMLSNASHCLA